MNFKEIIVLAGVVVVLSFAYVYTSGARTEALEAEARVHALEAERVELERQVKEATQGYEALADSLSSAHDSLAKVRTEASETASEASRSFNEGIGVLRDSLQAYSGLEGILDQVQADHEKEVVAYQVQVRTLKDDKTLLWKRVTVLDSLWVLEQKMNKSLRVEIGALNKEADAWKRLASTSFLGKLGGVVPYALVGAGIMLLIK